MYPKICHVCTLIEYLAFFQFKKRKEKNNYEIKDFFITDHTK